MERASWPGLGNVWFSAEGGGIFIEEVPRLVGRVGALAELGAWGTATVLPTTTEGVSGGLGELTEFNVTVERLPTVAHSLTRLQAEVAALRERIEDRPVAYNAQIHALGDPRYSLRHPLLVTIEDYDEEVVASMPEFDLYASGVSDSLALMGLKAEIVSTYERLTELGADKLGPLAFQCLEAMKKVIEPRHG